MLSMAGHYLGRRYTATVPRTRPLSGIGTSIPAGIRPTRWCFGRRMRYETGDGIPDRPGWVRDPGHGADLFGGADADGGGGADQSVGRRRGEPPLRLSIG